MTALELATELKSFIFTGYCSSFAIPYSRKFLREKTFANWWKIRFLWRKLRGLLACATPPNFAEKTFVNSHKTSKIRKSFLPRKFSATW